MNKQQPKKQEIIQRAVKAAMKVGLEAGIVAGRTQAERAVADAYRATERRLYALPTLIKKVEDARERLEELLSHGPQERSKDIVRFVRVGVRLSFEDIENDLYYPVVKGMYFEHISEEEIAKQIPGCLDGTHGGHCYRFLSEYPFYSSACRLPAWMLHVK